MRNLVSIKGRPSGLPFFVGASLFLSIFFGCSNLSDQNGEGHFRIGANHFYHLQEGEKQLTRDSALLSAYAQYNLERGRFQIPLNKAIGASNYRLYFGIISEHEPGWIVERMQEICSGKTMNQLQYHLHGNLHHRYRCHRDQKDFFLETYQDGKLTMVVYAVPQQGNWVQDHFTDTTFFMKRLRSGEN